MLQGVFFLRGTKEGSGFGFKATWKYMKNNLFCHFVVLFGCGCICPKMDVIMTFFFRLETGVPVRVKTFGVEIKNVKCGKCLRCGNYGHQSGDCECPSNDAVIPNEESRLKRDDPLSAIQAQTNCSESHLQPLKWELKQNPEKTPPRGGFNFDDPNHQVVAEDIFDEYGGFLGEANISELLTDFSSRKTKRKSKSKHGKKSPPVSDEIRNDEGSGSSSGDDRRRKSKK